jgi:hypothetical protein
MSSEFTLFYRTLRLSTDVLLTMLLNDVNAVILVH